MKPEPVKKTLITPKRIIQVVSDEHHLTPNALFYETRRRHIIEPRQIALYLIKLYSFRSLESIGKIALEYKRERPYNHATVLHACKTIENLIKTDVEIKTKVEWIVKTLNEKPLEEINKEYKDKYWAHQEKTRAVINSITEKKNNAVKDYQRIKQKYNNLLNIDVIV